MKPLVSNVLREFLIQRKLPHWTSYFVKYSDIKNDHHGYSHFNFPVKNTAGQVKNYEILRTGCYPFIKYHCTATDPPNDLKLTNSIIRMVKISTGCLPCLVYGTAARYLITHCEKLESRQVDIHFLIPEDHDARFWNGFKEGLKWDCFEM